MINEQLLKRGERTYLIKEVKIVYQIWSRALGTTILHMGKDRTKWVPCT